MSTKDEVKIKGRDFETVGTKAVSYSFNPDGNDRVSKAKGLLADAIDLLEEVHNEELQATQGRGTYMRNVFRTTAFTALTTASMALVKYVTWKD